MYTDMNSQQTIIETDGKPSQISVNAQVHKRSKPKKFRMMFRFWLDVYQDSDSWLADELEFLKSKRQMTKTIRNALRLLFDLQNGSTNVLFELFPELARDFRPYPNGNVQNDALQAQISRLEQLIADSQAIPSKPPEKPSSDVVSHSRMQSGSKSDDLDFEVKAASNTDENASYNAMLATLGIGTKLDDLPIAVIEYGVRRGKLPESALNGRKASQHTEQPKQAQNKHSNGSENGIRQIAGSNIDLATPNLEDIEF